MIPLKSMMARRSVPAVTILLIVVNVLVFCYQLSLSNAANDAFIRTFGLVPLKMQLALSGGRYTLAEAFLPLIYGVALAIVLTLFMKETGHDHTDGNGEIRTAARGLPHAHAGADGGRASV